MSLAEVTPITVPGARTSAIGTPHGALFPVMSAMRDAERERVRAAFGARSFDVQRVVVLHGGRRGRSVRRIGRRLNRPVEETPAIVATSRRLLCQDVVGAPRALQVSPFRGCRPRGVAPYLSWRSPEVSAQPN